jgi:iron complex transport system substrate-binding protein
MAAAGLLALLAPALPAQPIVVRDDRGTEHRLPAPPQRIVALLPSLTETVWALGGGARLVGVDRYTNWPPELAALPRLGGLDDALIEAIVALKPDVVLASTAARSIDRLEALGLRVLRLKPETQADIRRNFAVLAGLLGRPGADGAAWAGIEREIDAAAARVPPAWRGRRVYFEVDGGPYAAGTSSFIGETLARLGLGNVVPPELGPFPKLNPEYLLRARPDLLIGAQRGLHNVATRPGWATLPALQAQRLCTFAAPQYEILIRPGPRLGEAARLLADCLQRVGPSAAGIGAAR